MLCEIHFGTILERLLREALEYMVFILVHFFKVG